MSVGSVMAGYAFVKITMDDAELKRGLDSAQKKFKAFAAGVNAWSSKMAGLAPLIAAPMVMSLKTFSAFDDRMRQVQAVTGATGEAFAKLTEEAKRLGRETSFTAAQVSEGMLALGRMGLNPKEIEAAILPMMNLSRVTGTELGQAAEIAANNMRVFNLESSKMSHIADILSVTANSSAQTLVDLGEALKMAGPHAKRAGADLTETSAALGILANMGIRGSLAGTALGKSYKRLADPKVIQYLKEYGVETLNADGSMRRMRDTLVDIAKVMKTMTNAEQITFAEEVFDARGSLGGGTLSVNTEGIDQLMEKLKNAEGAAATAAKKMDDGIGGALRNMESAAEGVSIAFGEIISISFVPLINGTSNLLLGIRELIGENTALLGGLMQITATVVGFGAAIKALTFGTGVVKTLLAPITALDAMVSGTKKVAEAAVVAEKQKELAIVASTAKSVAAEKMKTAIAEAETAKRVALTAQENAAALAESQAKFAANERLIAASNTRIAQAQAESASTGKSAAAFIAAENAKQAELAETNLMLQQQIAAQKSVAVASAKGAVAAQAQATKSMQIAQSAAKASQAATAAEIAYGVSIKSSSALVAGKAAHIVTALKTQGAAAIFAKSSSAMLASANMKTMLTAMMAAKGTKTVTVALYAQAIGAKVVAGAMTGLRAIMTAIAAHPVAIAIIAVTAALWGLNKAFAASNQSAREFSEAAAKTSELNTQTREKGDAGRQNKEVMFERLKQLEEISKKGKLTAEEMQEAEDLMGKLGPGANSYIQSLDKISGKLTLANDAQEKFNKNMAQAAKSEIESEIAALEAERIALNAENDKLLSFWNYNLLALISGRHDEAIGQIEANGEKAVSIMKKIQAQKLRLKNIDAEDKNAVYGTESDGATINDRIEAEKQKRLESEEEVKKAAERLQAIEDDAAKRKMSNLEREVDGIQKLRDEYKRYMDMVIAAKQSDLKAAEFDMDKNKGGSTQAQKAAYAKALEAAEQARAAIAELEKRRIAANADFDRQTADAEKKDADRRAKERKPYDSFLGDLDAKEASDQQQKSENKAYDDAMQKKDYDAAYALVENLFKTQSAALTAARQQYNQKLEQAKAVTSDGGADLSESERADLDDLRKIIQEGTDRISAMREKMDSAREAAAEATERDPAGKISGAWQLADLAGALNNTAADRTAAATEKSAMLQEKANRKLDNIAKNSVLSYT